MLLDALERQDLLQRTLVVIAADHGEAFLEHGREGHAQDLHGEVTHVPLILLPPFLLEPGIRVRATVSNADLWPTLLDLLGLPPLPGADGRSLVPLVLAAAGAGGSADAAALERPVFAQLQRGWGRPKARNSASLVSVTDKNLRLLATVSGKTRPELFDRAVDPGEKRDLAAADSESAARLRALADDYANEREAALGRRAARGRARRAAAQPPARARDTWWSRGDRQRALVLRLELGALAVALERELDQPVEQRRVGQAGRLPQPRVHRDLGEAGQAVQLVHVVGERVAVDQEVDAREAARPRARDRRRSPLAQLLRERLGDRRRHEQLGALVDVLRLVVVPLALGADLARHRRLGRLVAEQRDLDLARVDAPLDQELRVVAHRVARARASSSARVFTLWMPTDEPRFAGFTKSGSRARASTRSTQPRGSRASSALRTHTHGTHRDARAARAAASLTSLSIWIAEPSTPAPDVRDAGELEQALQRAVLAAAAVHDREDHVEPGDDGLAARADAALRSPGTAGRLTSRPAARGESRLGRQRGRAEVPAPVLLDRDQASPRSAPDRARGGSSVAEAIETSCSTERPPNTSPTRSFVITPLPRADRAEPMRHRSVDRSRARSYSADRVGHLPGSPTKRITRSARSARRRPRARGLFGRRRLELPRARGPPRARRRARSR